MTALAIGLALPAATAAAQDWGGFARPSPAPAQAIGSHTRGCLAGAMALPLDGAGYQVMRVSRQRFYGHPQLIAFVEALAGQLQNNGHPGLLIGDLAQVRGGPMTSGHRSHQSGLDVDVWFLERPAGGVSDGERETLSAVSMVTDGGRSVNGGWGPAQQAALQAAALFDEVDRIFVNAAIKQALCDRATSGSEAGDRAWLRKVRPWWGHDAHFHVRLRCPVDSAECQAQEPLPPGDGCDAGLAWWFSDEAAEALAKAAAAPPAKALTLDDLPAACSGVFFAG
jgi:penicillin-insensitive murein endopeptidase